MTNAPSQWGLLIREITDRLCRPIKHPLFVIYFLGFVVLVGTLGLWLPNVQQKKPIAISDLVNNGATYYLALIAAACTEMLLSSKNKNLHMISILILVLCILSAAVTLASPAEVWSLVVVIVFAIISLVWWWISNADNEKLLEELNAQSPIGGDASQQLQGDLGPVKH